MKTQQEKISDLIVKLEKDWADATHPTQGKWCRSEKGTDYITNGHVMLYGPGLKALMPEGRVALTENVPNADAVIPVKPTPNAFAIPCFPFTVGKKITLTATFNGSLRGLHDSDSGFSIGPADKSSLIGFDVSYLQLLYALGFRSLAWSDAVSAAVGTQETDDLHAVIMPRRVESKRA